MSPEAAAGIMGATALALAGLMVALVRWPDGQKPSGLARNWPFYMMLCAMLAFHAVPGSDGPVWIQSIRAVIGVGVGIVYPWLLWRLYIDLRHRGGPEKME